MALGDWHIEPVETKSGTGDLELRLRTKADLDAAKPLIVKSYEAS